MKPYGIIAATVVLYFVGISQAAKVDEKCLEAMEGIINANMGNMVPCIESLGFAQDAKERAKHYNCIMKCVLMKSGTFNSEGRISVLNGLGFVLEHFPTQYIDKALFEISKCQEFANVEVNDPNDTKCEKMKPLVNCGVEFMMNICKI